jgi:hypothetical protein
VFSTLGRLDWSKFELKFCSPTTNGEVQNPYPKDELVEVDRDCESHEADDGIDVDLNSKNEVILLVGYEGDDEAVFPSNESEASWSHSKNDGVPLHKEDE